MSEIDYGTSVYSWLVYVRLPCGPVAWIMLIFGKIVGYKNERMVLKGRWCKDGELPVDKVLHTYM